MCFSVPVNPKECALCEPKYWGCLSREAAQERVEPPPFQMSVERRVPSGPVRRKRADKAPDEINGEKAAPKDLRHRLRRPTAPEVGQGI